MTVNRKRKSRKWTVPAFLTVFFLAVAVISFGALAVQLHTYNNLSANGGKATATVVSLQRHSTKSSYWFNPVSKFTTVSGETITHEFNNVPNEEGHWSVGDKLTIAYDKAKPNHAIVVGSEALQDQKDSKVKSFIALAISGLFFLLWMVTLAFKAYRNTHPKAKGSRRQRSVKAETKTADADASKS